MKSAGIICECNPFHDGHRRLIQAARDAGCDTVICTLSDPFVQRGEPALCDARARAEAVLRGGADAVVALPFPYAAASADFFARAGVDILSRLGVDELWFGSECGDLPLLAHAAAITATPEFRDSYANASPSRGRTAAFLDALVNAGISAEPFSSNDLLGIAYLRAITDLASPIVPHTILRTGSAYNNNMLVDGVLPSATALRSALLAGTPPSELSMLPPESRTSLTAEAEAGNAPATWKAAERALLAALRVLPTDAVDRVAELSGGLGRRILHAAEEASTLEELLSLCANRTYTDARIRRGILFALCNITEQDLRTPPAWVRLLAANGQGCRYLALRRGEGCVPVVTKAADIPADMPSLTAARWERRAYALWSLCLPESRTANDFLKQPPQILN